MLRREFYEHLRDWIVETELDRYRSGRVFEYMWAIMFGAPPVSHPLEECDLLTCTVEVRANPFCVHSYTHVVRCIVYSFLVWRREAIRYYLKPDTEWLLCPDYLTSRLGKGTAAEATTERCYRWSVWRT